MSATKGESLTHSGRRAAALQPYGVEHPAGCLTDSWGGRALHGFAREPLHDNSAETVQITEVGEFNSVAEGAAGNKDGIPKTQRADIYAQVDCACNVHCRQCTTDFADARFLQCA